MPPMYMASGLLGEWLARRWNTPAPKWTSAINAIVCLLVFLSLQIAIVSTFSGFITPTATRGRAWAAGFLAGFWLYFLLPAAEGGRRRQK